MNSTGIKLHLKNHCIETASKKELKRLTDTYLESTDSPDDILKMIELLQDFIKQSDFPALRAGDERLSGIKESIVKISRGESGNIIINIE